MRDPLLTAIGGSHRALDDQLAEVARAVKVGESNQAVVQKTDAFMIHACRHLSATCVVVLPSARRALPDGRRRVRAYVRQARRLERSVARAKGRVYGQSRAMGLAWPHVWARVGRELEELMVIERALVADLAIEVGPRVSSRLVGRLVGSEAGSPTRPHPNSPHTGWPARLSRGLWSRADTFWDAAEGRIVTGAVKAFKAPARLAS